MEPALVDQLLPACKNKIFHYFTRYCLLSASGDDQIHLQEAVQHIAQKIFDALTPREQSLVGYHIYQLAACPQTDDPLWGMHHAKDDVHRLLRGLTAFSCGREALFRDFPDQKDAARTVRNALAVLRALHAPSQAKALRELAVLSNDWREAISNYVHKSQHAHPEWDDLVHVHEGIRQWASGPPSSSPLMKALKTFHTKRLASSAHDTPERQEVISTLCACIDYADHDEVFTRLEGWINSLELTHQERVAYEVYRFLSDPSAHTLTLRGLQLSTLPPIFDRKPFTDRLRFFDCSANRLEQLPLEKCAHLEELHASWNRLRQLPPWLDGHTKLHTLNLFVNPLNPITTSVPQMPALRELDLSFSHLACVPADFLFLPRIRTLFLTGCPLSAVTRLWLRQTVMEPDYQGPVVYAYPNDMGRNVLKIMHLMGALCLLTDEPICRFYNLLGYSDENLLSWLESLGDMKDFSQTACIRNILNHLQYAQENSDFRSTFFAVINEVVARCGDRMAFSILHLDVQRALNQYDKSNLHSLSHLLIHGIWCLQLLEQCAQDKLCRILEQEPNFKEDLEVYLAYPVRLRERLQLPISVQGMQFENWSRVNDDDLSVAQRYVRTQIENPDAVRAFLINHDLWRQALQQRYPLEYADIFDAYDRERNIAESDEEFLRIQTTFQNRMKALTEQALAETGGTL
jgi:hypothetical protein